MSGYRENTGRPTPRRDEEGVQIRTLPAWVYHDQGFFALERKRLFAGAWQIVCHVSEIANPGDYRSFAMPGRIANQSRQAFVIRGDDGEIRGFHNVCRHRAHAVVTQAGGHCAAYLRCPYHGWTYEFDGRNRSISGIAGFRSGPDPGALGLFPVEVEVVHGFVFLRFETGGHSVAQLLSPFADELTLYRLADLRAWGDPWMCEREADWKTVVENYVEDYHFPLGHPGLSALMDSEYDRECTSHGAIRLSHRIRAEAGNNWSARAYRKLLPDYPHLGPARERWTYIGFFPGVYFNLYPESVDYLQVLPVAPGRVCLRSQSYALPDARREARAVRFLGLRINQRVQDEDDALTESVQRGLASGVYGQGILSAKEKVVRGFQDWIRARLPCAGLTERPAPADIERLDAQLRGP